MRYRSCRPTNFYLGLSGRGARAPLEGEQLNDFKEAMRNTARNRLKVSGVAKSVAPLPIVVLAVYRMSLLSNVS
jgi:hypothetical protein